LTKPLDRVLYNPLAPLQRDFDLIQDLMIQSGVLDRRLEFQDYVDDRFAIQAATMTPWMFEPGQM
jgi:NitT/TauT family transport system substrate-binding protein